MWMITSNLVYGGLSVPVSEKRSYCAAVNGEDINAAREQSIWENEKGNTIALAPTLATLERHLRSNNLKVHYSQAYSSRKRLKRLAGQHVADEASEEVRNFTVPVLCLEKALLFAVISVAIAIVVKHMHPHWEGQVVVNHPTRWRSKYSVSKNARKVCRSRFWRCMKPVPNQCY